MAEFVRNSHHRKRSRSRSRSRHRKSKKYSHHERRRSESASSESEDDADFNFERHKSRLCRIFFRDEDIVKHGSKEYEDFWKFLDKYQSLQRKKKLQGGSSSNRKRKKHSLSDTLSVPTSSDQSYNLNFEMKPNNSSELMNRLPFRDDPREGLSESKVMKFRSIVSIYIDFLQREKFNRLKKLRKSQANLPIAEYREKILDTLESEQVLIVAGDTGCGKSTQVPQYLLQAGYTNIACTQPRRLACISLANRVSYETLNQYGQEIGYQIRFEKTKTQNTKVVFLTEGLLLRQVSSDPGLGDYNVIVLDEVHERHLHGDFLLGIVKCLLLQRKDLRVILMSATINIDLFKNYFGEGTPVVQVPGRLFPISLHYHPIPCLEDTDRLNPAPYVRILQLIDSKYPETERGDLLIFLSGLTEITKVVDAAREYAERNNRWVVLPLHSTLSLAEQDKVFDYPPSGVRKAIVSTNIAETSLTIDGVRFVCDSGKVKEMIYDPDCKMQRLKEFWVSRASAEQRKGRAGRTGPGVCFRLYSEQEFSQMAAYSKPEVERVPLDSTVLQLTAMGLPDVRKFPFIEPPPPESLENSISILKEQGALTETEELTAVGKVLSGLPVDVSIGKMLIMGTLFHQVESVLSLAAVLSVQSPFTNKAYRDSECVTARRNLDSDHGDPITLLNAFREWLKVKSDERENSRKWCRRRGIEEQRFYEVIKIRKQFEQLLEDSKLLSVDTRGEEGMTSAERMARHGELRHLKNMRREAKNTERKKKTLKVGETEEVLEAEDDKMDLKDIEFRIRNDTSKVRQLLSSSSAVSYKDVMMLKLILTSGLYPQLALADEFNSYKAGTDQIFHTRVKPFNVLHPNSIFSSQPEVLMLDSASIKALPEFSAKHPASACHQVLVYLSLLETTKPYLTATLRMPTLPALLLFSHSIDTNSGLSRIVADKWLEVVFADPQEGGMQVVEGARLRSLWESLLSQKLSLSSDQVLDKAKQAEALLKLERELQEGLVAFLHSETVFSVKRLLPADLKVLYVGPGSTPGEPPTNPFSASFPVAVHPVKGGFRLSPQITYSCLVDSAAEASALYSLWMCPHCQEERYSGLLEKLEHTNACGARQGQLRQEINTEKERNKNPLAKKFFCQTCERTLDLTSSEILRHRRDCKT